MQDLEKILETAIEIAEQGGALALSYFRKAILIEIKDNLTPVTVADKKTEEFMRKELTAAFPGFGILGEEFGEEAVNNEYVWTIDPIDGTRSFIRGIPLFGTLLGLLKNGEPILGVMVLPALKETYSAALGLGTYCNGHQLHVSPNAHLASANIALGDAYAFRETGTEKLFELLSKKAELARGYTDCFGHSLVMRGSLDAMVDPLVSIWDVAPLAILTQEAGGDYFSFEGERTIRDKSFVACSPKLREELLSLIVQSKS